MGNPIYYVGGSKGGVGKSAVASGLVDYLLVAGKSLLLVEGDTANPDVGWAYENEKGVAHVRINLDHPDGWSDLLDDIEKHKDRTVVINTPARNNMSVMRSSKTLTDSLEELDRELVVFWVINRQRDSIELLKEFMSKMEGAHIHVVRNLHHGMAEEFSMYNASALRLTIETECKGSTFDFPSLAGRVADALNVKRLAISKGVVDLTLGNRAELRRWRREVAKSFAGVIGE